MFANRTNWDFTPNHLSEALATHRAAAKPLLDLTVSNPTECGFAYAEQEILRALASPSALRYEPDPRGMHGARSAVAKYYSGRGTQVPIEDIFLTTSTSEAYSLAFRILCNPGDGILVPAPSYPLFDYLADIHDVKLCRYPLLYDHGWQIDFHLLEKRIGERTRAVIVVHPNNPTGHFTQGREVTALTEMCARHDLALIVDEVFLDFSLDGQAPRSLAANTRALTFTASGLSKISGLPQMKAAWLVANGPAELKAQALARLEVVADTYLSMNAPIQLAMPAFLEQRHEFQTQLIERVRKNLAELDRQLASQHACSRLKIEGGWYGVVRLPLTLDDEEFAISLLTTQNVYVHPGHFYEFPDRTSLVLSLITSEPTFADGVKALLSYANR